VKRAREMSRRRDRRRLALAERRYRRRIAGRPTVNPHRHTNALNPGGLGGAFMGAVVGLLTLGRRR